MLILSPREKLIRILLALKDRIASPSDIISATGLPRYEVLAAFHILDALGLVEPVYTRGNYKLYRLTNEGSKVIEALSSGKKIIVEIKVIGEPELSSSTVNAALHSTASGIEISAEA